MTTMTKFSFDTSFDAPTPSDEALLEETVPPPPVFTEADIARARADGIAEGRAAGLAESMATHEAQQAAALDRIASTLAEIAPGHDKSLEASRLEVLTIARAVIAKIVPEIAKENAFALVEAAIVSVMPKLMDEPRAVIRVNDDLLDPLQDVIGEVKRKAGYAGDVILLSEDGFGPADCTVEWADGGAEYHQDEIWKDVDEAMERYVSGEERTELREPESHKDQTPQPEETPHG